MGKPASSVTISVTLLPDLAWKARILAEREDRSVEDVCAEAIDAYYAQNTLKSFEDIWAYAATRNPAGYTEADIPRLIKEVGAEMPLENSDVAEEEKFHALKAS